MIFDEAHNMESICAESASFDITSKDLALCINEVSPPDISPCHFNSISYLASSSLPRVGCSSQTSSTAGYQVYSEKRRDGACSETGGGVPGEWDGAAALTRPT